MTDKPRTVEEYIASKPKEAQERLEELRSYLKVADPSAAEELKWGKPAFVRNGVLYVYAAAKNHISLHPTPSVINHFLNDLESFKLYGNTVRFPLGAPIPKDIVQKLAALRVRQKDAEGVGWK